MTYSILARDAATGEMGLACQSQAFAVGGTVPWAEAGIGVVASQSVGEPLYADLGIDLMRGGLTAPEALAALRSIDGRPDLRQVAMLAGPGRADAYTGEGCVGAAGHTVDGEVCAMGNMLADDGVWPAMAEAYAGAEGQDLARRLLAALHAAEAAGGDLRGRRSAAVLVVRAARTGRPWQDQVADLRVDEHDQPVAELRRLLDFADTYRQGVHGFELLLGGHPEEAVDALADLDHVIDDQPDLLVHRVVALALSGQRDEAEGLLARLAAEAPQFVELARRIDRTALGGFATDLTSLADAADRSRSGPRG